MIVTIDSQIKITNVPPDQLKQIKNELTIKNPEFTKKKAMGLPIWGTPREIELITEENGTYILPRGYLARLWEITDGKMDIADNRSKREYIEFPLAPNLREYQKPALFRAALWEQGVILMPCGAGKTETALAVVADIGQPALWITHTMDLLTQSMERAVSRLGLEGEQIGVIQGKNMKVGTHITFATVQTLSKRDLKALTKRFGCIIVDECHLCVKSAKGAAMFASVISQFSAFYRFGVTASEHRADGLVETMFHILGPKIYEVGQEELNAAGNVIVPRVEFIETTFKYEPPTTWKYNQETGEKEEVSEILKVKSMIAEMRCDQSRNLIIKDILLDAQDSDFFIVLGESLAHLQELKEFIINFLGRKAVFVCGDTPKKERDKMMAGMREGRYQYLLATYQLAKLGLDIPRLNKLVLATPVKDKTTIQQAAGRIMRPAEGKTQPVIYDLLDPQIPQLRAWAKERIKVYKKLGCQI